MAGVYIMFEDQDKEVVFTEIVNIKKEKDISLIEATVFYCEDHDIEVEDFVKFMKNSVGIDLIKAEAIENKMVSRKFYGSTLKF